MLTNPSLSRYIEISMGMNGRSDPSFVQKIFQEDYWHISSSNAFLYSVRCVPVRLGQSNMSLDVKWSLKAGDGLDGVVKYKNRLIVSTTSSGFVLNEYNNDLKLKSVLPNITGGICAEFSVRNRSFLVESYYSRSGSLANSNTHAHLEGFRFSVGMFL